MHIVFAVANLATPFKTASLSVDGFNGKKQHGRISRPRVRLPVTFARLTAIS